MTDVLSSLPRLLQTLEPTEQPTDGLQIMPAERPFEPNPLVPTVVHGLDHPEAWGGLLRALRSALSADQPLLLLRSGSPSEATTLARLADARPEAEALFIPAVAPEAAERSLHGLRWLVHHLRAPNGCPWDRKQTHESLVRYVIEEAYEVADAIRHEGPAELADELGDLLLQVVLHAELAEETGDFTLNDVAERISTKLIRRHPHVFGDLQVDNAAQVERNWDQLKAAEKTDWTSALDGVPRSMPALPAAQEIQRRLKKVGFDWPDRAGVDQKLAEELAELRAATTPERAAAELGDVLFILARLGLDQGADAEEALRGTNRRVSARFRHVEEQVRSRGLAIKDAPLHELSALWDEAKATESV